MATTIVCSSNPTPKHPHPINISHNTSEEAYKALAEAASTRGVALITNLAVKLLIAYIQRLFDTLYSSPTLAAHLNAIYPTRGVFKATYLNPDSTQP